MPQANSKIIGSIGITQAERQEQEENRMLYEYLDGELLIYENMARHYLWHKVEALLALARIELKEYICPLPLQSKGNKRHG